MWRLCVWSFRALSSSLGQFEDLGVSDPFQIFISQHAAKLLEVSQTEEGLSMLVDLVILIDNCTKCMDDKSKHRLYTDYPKIFE